jgi:hypothetical protein
MRMDPDKCNNNCICIEKALVPVVHKYHNKKNVGIQYTGTTDKNKNAL